MFHSSSQGNKGGVSVRFSFYGHMLCFLNCHLAAHMNYALQRVDEFEYILDTQDFEEDTPHVLDHKSVSAIQHHTVTCTQMHAHTHTHTHIHMHPSWPHYMFGGPWICLFQGGLLVWRSELPHRRSWHALPPLIHQQ